MHKIMLDTNTLVDYYLGREPGCSACTRIIDLTCDQHAVYVSALSLKDTYYLVAATLKRAKRMDSGSLSDADAAACNEIAWACVRQCLDFALVTNVGRREALDAFVLRSLHQDFEDNLVLASARSAEVDFIVTGDERLRGHSPISALSPTDMANLLEAEAQSQHEGAYRGVPGT